MAEADKSNAEQRDLNRDPITGEPGSHPVATGVGALAGGAAAGAVVGTMAGPVGTVIGAAVGALAGGLAGHALAEVIDPTAEHEHWRTHFRDQPYVEPDANFEDYGPAYWVGVDAAARNPEAPHHSFTEIEGELERDWARFKGESRLTWKEASPAVRAAWDRIKDRKLEG